MIVRCESNSETRVNWLELNVDNNAFKSVAMVCETFGDLAVCGMFFNLCE